MVRRDPNAPRRPLTPYFMWLRENRENIKQENPGFGDMIIMVAI
jgi:hypothetical protein